MTITKKDVGRPIIFQGFNNGIYEGHIDKVHTTDFGYTFASIVYAVPPHTEPFRVPLSKKNWDRISFRVTT